MGVLPDHRIVKLVESGKLGIEPFDEAAVQPASYDFRLGSRFLTFDVKSPTLDGKKYGWDLDLARAESDLIVEEWKQNHYVLTPASFVLAVSQEYFTFPDDVAGKVMTKSSLGRLGLMVSNGDACWFDPGFKGYAVLELRNNGPLTIILRSGMRVGQMVFLGLESPSMKAYAGHYLNQVDFAVEKWKKSLTKLVMEALR